MSHETSPLLNKVDSEHKHNGVNIITLIWLAPAIASVVIATEYDESTSPCRFDTYTIGLRYFLLCVGGVHLVHFALHTIGICCNTCFTSSEDRKKYQPCVNAVICCILIFDLLMAIIGTIMYTQQMNDLCQTQDIGKMILAWCVVNFVIIGISCCCVTCYVCCVCISAT
eukprot:183887_1